MRKSQREAQVSESARHRYELFRITSLESLANIGAQYCKARKHGKTIGKEDESASLSRLLANLRVASSPNHNVSVLVILPLKVPCKAAFAAEAAPLSHISLINFWTS